MSSIQNSTITNIARPAFETINKGTSSGDYLKNKKSKLAYCNSKSCGGKPAQVSSYSQKLLFENGKYLNTIKNSGTLNPNHKHDLINNLFSAVDLSGTNVITDVSNNEPTCIDISLIPFYESYNIDTDGSLFGNSICTINNYVDYMVPNLNYLPPPTVLFNRS